LKPVLWINFTYEGGSVNRSQMGIKCKTCDIRTWGEHLFLDIFSTNFDTLVPSLYQFLETRSIEVFWLLSQPLPHLNLKLFSFSETSATFLDPAVNRFKRQTLPSLNRRHFFVNILCIESLSPLNTHNIILLFGSTAFKHGRHFDYWNQPLNMGMRVCYLDYHEAELYCYLVIVHYSCFTSICDLFTDSPS
jgi:hypothetical protein